MKIVKESPDTLKYYDGKREIFLSYSDSDAMPFGMAFGGIHVGYKGSIHGFIEVYGHGGKGEGEGFADDEYINLTRAKFEYPGRIWINHKVIAFWETPAKNKLKAFVDELSWELQQRGFDIDIWKENFRLETDSIYIANRAAAESVLEPIQEYVYGKSNPKEYSKEEKGKSHQQSPLLKKKKTIPSSVGSKKYAEKKPLPYRYKLVKESPDEFMYPGHPLGSHADFFSDNAYAFGYALGKDRKGKIFISDESDTHTSIMLPNPDPNDKRDYITISRNDFAYPGRVWIDHKVISFWATPPKKSLKSWVDNISKELNKIGKHVDIWDENYDIEIYSNEGPDYLRKSKFIPIQHYVENNLKSDTYPKEQLDKDHVNSPIKKKDKEVPSGIGSKKYGEQKPLKYRYKLVPESLKEL